MGYLKRMTLKEVQELYETDAGWWEGFCASVAEGGHKALKAERDMRGWSWGALWKWIRDDEGRRKEYEDALEAYAQDLALETVGIADGVEDAALGRLRVETRFKVAGKLDRERWGDKVQAGGGVGLPLADAALIGFAGEMLKRIRVVSVTEKVVGGTDEPV